MNTLVIVLIAAVVLVCAYAGYGRWLAKTWGVDPNAKTPAVRLEDGKDCASFCSCPMAAFLAASAAASASAWLANGPSCPLSVLVLVLDTS